MRAIFSKKAAKTLKSQDKDTRDRILEGIQGIPQGDIKPLVGYSDGRMRLRVGKYRVIFIEDEGTDDDGYVEKIAIVLDIGSRGDIYK